MLRIKSHKKPDKFGLLPPGDHYVRIDSVQETFNKDWKLLPWEDKTPQLAIRFKGAHGYITQWVNLKGYMTNIDYEDQNAAEATGIIFKQHPFSKIKYAVDLKTNTRIENEDKTMICLHIIGRIANCGGMPAGIDFEVHELIGLEMLIRVEKDYKVTHTFKRK